MTDKIKRGDLLPDWSATLYDGDPSAVVDLTTATSIRVIGMRDKAIVIDEIGTGNAAGKVVMAWSAGDTDDCGQIEFEVKVTWPGTKVQTFPVDHFLTTTVYEDSPGP